MKNFSKVLAVLVLCSIAIELRAGKGKAFSIRTFKAHCLKEPSYRSIRLDERRTKKEKEKKNLLKTMDYENIVHIGEVTRKLNQVRDIDAATFEALAPYLTNFFNAALYADTDLFREYNKNNPYYLALIQRS